MPTRYKENAHRRSVFKGSFEVGEHITQKQWVKNFMITPLKQGGTSSCWEACVMEHHLEAATHRWLAWHFVVLSPALHLPQWPGSFWLIRPTAHEPRFDFIIEFGEIHESVGSSENFWGPIRPDL